MSKLLPLWSCFDKHEAIETHSCLSGNLTCTEGNLLLFGVILLAPGRFPVPHSRTGAAPPAAAQILPAQSGHVHLEWWAKKGRKLCFIRAGDAAQISDSSWRGVRTKAKGTWSHPPQKSWIRIAVTGQVQNCVTDLEPFLLPSFFSVTREWSLKKVGQLQPMSNKTADVLAVALVKSPGAPSLVLSLREGLHWRPGSSFPFSCQSHFQTVRNEIWWCWTK